MTDFVLIPGAGGDAAFWNWLMPELAARGHHGVPVDIPEDDPTLGLDDWAACVVRAVGTREGVVLVAQSLGGFLAPMVAERVPVEMIVLVNAMVPVPGEQPQAWWDATGSEVARRAAEEAAGRDPTFDLDTHFFHDLPPDRRADLLSGPPPRQPSSTAMADHCRFTGWPADVRAVVGHDDRFFPADFQRRVARERLGVDVDVLPGGHLLPISQPVALGTQLSEYLTSR